MVYLPLCPGTCSAAINKQRFSMLHSWGKLFLFSSICCFSTWPSISASGILFQHFIKFLFEHVLNCIYRSEIAFKLTHENLHSILQSIFWVFQSKYVEFSLFRQKLGGRNLSWIPLVAAADLSLYKCYKIGFNVANYVYFNFCQGGLLPREDLC